MDHLPEKELLIRFTVRVFDKLLAIFVYELLSLLDLTLRTGYEF